LHSQGSPSPVRGKVRDAAPTRLLALVGADDTLLGLETQAARLGARVVRLDLLRFQRIPHGALVAAFAPQTDFDTLVFTSRQSVRHTAGLPEIRRRIQARRELEVLAVGPRTAEALQELGIPPHWTGDEGNAAVLSHLKSMRRRRVVYPRSDRAGTTLANSLRRQGHTVQEVVAYRVLLATGLPKAQRQALASTEWLVVTSPSAVRSLRAAISARLFDQLRSRGKWVAIGARTARAMRGHGIRGVQVAASPTAEAIGRLLRED
jgi:uroporphyrinogen-III synthase